MPSSAPRYHGADKAVWGRAILFTALVSFALPGIPAEAQLLKLGQNTVSAAAAKQAAHEARKARRHAKLDQLLNDAVEDQANGQSAVIIAFHDDRDALTLVKANGGKAGRRLGILKARVAKMPNRQLKALANDSRVKSIHLDRPTKSFAGRTAVTIGARAVQELMGYDGAGIGVGVIDSGITAWHDDLTTANGQGQRVAHFADFVNGYTQPYDDFGHGTHVAGIVAGNGRDMNGARTAIAPGAHIIALKALDGEGHGTISMIIAAIDYAVANKDALNLRVLNLSLGASVTESYNTDPLTLAAKRAVDAGIVVVASAGNRGKGANGQPQYATIGSPGNAPWVITVGASSHNGTVLRQDDTIASFSSRGPTMYDLDVKPDLVAPGHGTVSLSDPVSLFYTEKSQYLLGGLVGTSYTPYLTLSGTSMAAPAVAGTVALMLQANPTLTPNLVKAILQFTSQEYPGYDALTQGTGFLNSRGAVVLAEYFQQAVPGSPYPSMNGWSKQIFWGNKRVHGGVPVPGATAWGAGVVWGSTETPSGNHVVWGDNCADASCSGVVLGNSFDDNIVWGNSFDDNIVWGNSYFDNIVWGNSDLDNIVWGNSDFDNIVWGNSFDDNIVWGNSFDDNIVWGNSGFDNIVWGNSVDDLLGNTTQLLQNVVGDETNEVNSLPSNMWDVMFPLDAQWPTTPNNAPAEETAPPAEETAPPAEETAPPAEETAPLAEETPPPVEETAPPAEETPPPGTPLLTPLGSLLGGIGGLN
jgi:serine protease AprX